MKNTIVAPNGVEFEIVNQETYEFYDKEMNKYFFTFHLSHVSAGFLVYAFDDMDAFSILEEYLIENEYNALLASYEEIEELRFPFLLNEYYVDFDYTEINVDIYE